MPPSTRSPAMASRSSSRSPVGPVTAPERLRERRDDDAVLRAQEVREPPRPPRTKSMRRACSGCCRRAACRSPAASRAREVDRLRHVVLEHAERGGVEAADEPAGLVLHRRFEQHAGDLGSSRRTRTAASSIASRDDAPARRSPRRESRRLERVVVRSTRRHRADPSGRRRPARRRRRTGHGRPGRLGAA